MTTFNILTYFENLKSIFTNDNPFLTNAASLITILAPVFALIGLMWNIGLKIWVAHRRTHVCPDCLEMKEVNQYTKLYIKTRFTKTNDFSNKKDYTYNMKKFVHQFLDKGDDQYHWIFGESGTGKTAFLINMYFYYNCRVFKKNTLYYISLRSASALDEIKAISKDANSKNTILLLDAFDESSAAAINANDALNVIIGETKGFYKVILTCRTHFFNSIKDEPQVIGVNRAVLVDDEIFVKHYVCPFSGFEVLQYLIKHYKLKFWNVFRGVKVIKTSSNIMARPLLLSYIDDIVYERQNYRYAHQIYNTLIQKWIEREINFIRKTNGDYVDILAFTTNFWDFTYEIAEIMLQNAGIRDDYSADIQQLNRLCEKYNIDKSISKRSRTLLNRASNDRFAFSHKSIFEFLLASGVKAGKIDLNFSQVNISSLDQFILFTNEMYQNGELAEIIHRVADQMKVSFNEALMEETEKASIDSIEISLGTNRIYAKLIIQDSFYTETTVRMIKRYCSTLREHDYSQYTIFSIFDNNRYIMNHAYITIINNVTGVIMNKNIVGKLVMDMQKTRLFVMDNMGNTYPYWDVPLFVEKMPINIITQFVIEQLSLPDNHGSIIHTVNNETNNLEILIQLVSVEK